MIDEQTVRARAVEGALGTASNGTEQVGVQFVLLEGPDEGKNITWYGFFTEKTVDRTIESLRLCGWQGDDLSDLTGIDANDVYLVIAHEENQKGETIARVQWVNGQPQGLAMKDRMDEGTAKAFAERMKGHVLAAKARTKGSSPNAPKKAPGPNAANGGNDFAPGNEDIPF